jgi:transglutaminase-like putative cysteine protease
MIRRCLSLVVTAALVATAGLAFHRVFGWGPIIPVIAVATLVPTLLSALLSGPRRSRTAQPAAAGSRRWPLWISLVLTICAWTATVCLTLFRDRLSDGSVPQAIGSGLRDSWESILTTLPPAPARPEFLVLVHVVVWLAAFASAELALRTSARAAPVLPALAAFTVALLLGVDGPGSNVPIAVALVTLLVVLVLVRSEEPGRLALGLPIALVLGLVAFLAGPYLPVSGEPYDPRSQVAAPPPQRRDSVSPLDRVSAWVYSPDQQMFTVRASRAENWRLAVLDHFDGVTWTSSARFVPTGSRVPPAPEPGRRRTVDQQITIQELPGVWVPAADRVRSIDGLGVAVDTGSGTLAAGQPLHSGQSYRVTSSVREWTADELAGAAPAQDAEARAALELPWGPGATKAPPELADFRQLAQQATRGAYTPIQQASQLQTWLSGRGKYDVTARPGHNYAQLRYFLVENHERGTSEHFATAYAVMARTLGLPTRVVVGFRPGEATGGLRQVTSGDVLVWPEVKFARLGWVPFYPTPEKIGRGTSGSVAAGETQQKLENIQKNAASRQGGRGPGASNATTPPRRLTIVPGSSTPWWAYVLVAIFGLILAYVVVVLLVPFLRRRRRRSWPTPSERITGAWLQVVEHLGDVGLSGVRTLTAHEVVHFGTRSVGEPAAGHLRPLADLVNRSRFSSSAPGPHAAEMAWQHCDAVGRLVTERAGRFYRMRRRLHPRSLSRKDPVRVHDEENPSR